MNRRREAAADAGALRVGLFGNLGSGNIGNDASMEAVLAYLRAEHPGAAVSALCGRPDEITRRYGLDAFPLYWFTRFERRVSGIPAIPLKLAGKVADVFRVAGWTRRQNVVIIPGMGVLEASLPLRPWGFPYTMFLVCAAGRLFGTKVAMVSVGAGIINQTLTRRLFDAAARLAFYRSYRNQGSREAMRRRGVDISRDQIYPDLAFALPAPPSSGLADPKIVCVGVMDFHGSNDDRGRADEIYASYLAGMKSFVRWLADDGREVRLLIGDTNGSDGKVVEAILDDLRENRPEVVSRVSAVSVTTLDDVMQAMVLAGSVVAIRFHNVLAALKLCKPTVAISYSPKHDALMADMGVAEFSVPADPFDPQALERRFADLEARSSEVAKILAGRNEINEKSLDEQFVMLTRLLFPSKITAY